MSDETNKRHDTEIKDLKLRLTSKEVELEERVQQYDDLEDLDQTNDEESKYALDGESGRTSHSIVVGDDSVAPLHDGDDL